MRFEKFGVRFGDEKFENEWVKLVFGWLKVKEGKKYASIESSHKAERSIRLISLELLNLKNLAINPIDLHFLVVDLDVNKYLLWCQ